MRKQPGFLPLSVPGSPEVFLLLKECSILLQDWELLVGRSLFYLRDMKHAKLPGIFHYVESRLTHMRDLLACRESSGSWIDYDYDLPPD